MKKVSKYAIIVAVPAILIMLAYSPTTYFRYFDFPFVVTFASYVIVYLMVLAVTVLAAPMVGRRMRRTAISRVIIEGAIATVSFAALSVVCGMTGFNPPHTRVHGIFFSEWKFMNFFFYVGLPTAIVSAATAFLDDDLRPATSGMD